LVMTVIGVAGMQGTTQQEKMAGNMRNRNLAFQAAEAALRAGERYVDPAGTPPADSVFTASTPGLTTTLTSMTSGDDWMSYNWATSSQTYSDGTLTEVSQQPRYVIEDTTATDPACSGATANRCFRITARGVGGTDDAVVILQSTYIR
jgi:type IV pilus assembly protein PilX